MKIAFTGAGGTGKTTLAKYLADKWSIPYVGSVSREVMAEMRVESEMAQESMTVGMLYELQTAIMQRRRDKLAGLKDYVTDRCALDNYIYALRRCGPALTGDAIKEWEDLAVKDLLAQDLVFYAPTGMFKTEHDGIRVTEIAHQELMDVAMYGFLCKHGLDRCSENIHILSMGDLDRRKIFCDSLVSEIFALQEE